MFELFELFPWTHPIWGAAVFLIGASIGSFLNVVIYRVPRGMSVNEPKRSFCPKCKKEIPMWRNIPIVTWLLQRGKCAECGEGIAVRYLLVELATALIWLSCWWFLLNSPELAAFYMVLAAILIPIVLIDAELMVIPRSLTILGAIVGLAAGGLLPEHLGELTWQRGLMKAGFGLLIGWFSLWMVVLLGKMMFGKREFKFANAVAWMLPEPVNDEEELCFVIDGEAIGWSDIFYRKSDKLVMSAGGKVCLDGDWREFSKLEIHDDYVKIDGEITEIEKMSSLEGETTHAVIPREAMGMGDVDLLGMLGACFGPASLLLTIFGACIVSLLWALVARLGLGRMMPFGPSIVGGAVIWVLWGEDIWQWYIAFVMGA